MKGWEILSFSGLCCCDIEKKEIVSLCKLNNTNSYLDLNDCLPFKMGAFALQKHRKTCISHLSSTDQIIFKASPF